MTKIKSTKHALLMSALALLLCASMLIGSTFAWFTDSVSNGVNKIVSGNLDVELWHSNYLDTAAASQWGVGFGYSEAEGEEVGPDTALFLNEDGEPILWEPGATAVENFRIKNVGSLALKFMFKLNITNATKTPDGRDLTEIIDLYIDEINWQDNGVPTGTTIVVKKLGDGYVIEGELLAGEDYDFWVGLEWEPSDIDNEFNVKDGLSLDLGITLLATQLTYEKDGYNGDQYDADAEYPDFSQQLATGGYLKLIEDSALATPIVLNKDAVLDLNGHTLVIDTNAGSDITVTNGATLTIKNGTLVSDSNGDSKAILATNTKAGTTTTVTLENVDVKLASPTYEDELSNSIFANAEEGEVVVNINEGTTITAESTHHAPVVIGKNAIVNMNEGSVIDIANVDPEGGWTCVWGVYLDDESAVFNMNGGTIKVRGEHSATGIYAYDCAPTVNITGGTIDVETTGSGYGIAVEVYKGTVNVTGGEFNIKATNGTAYAFEEASALDLNVGGTAVINVWGELNTKNTAYESGNANPNADCTAKINQVITVVADLDTALQTGGDVLLPVDTTISANDTTANSGYGATGVRVDNGATFDGNGNTLTVNNANGTWGCAINASSGTIQNLTVSGAMRGIFMGGATGDVYINNVVFDDVIYTFNSDGGNKEYGVYISNSTLNGWTSFSDVHKEVVFTDCTFGEGNGYAFCRPYNKSVFKNCVFEEGFEFDTSKTGDIVFENCYYGDTLITAENAASLATGDVVFFYNGLNGITITNN